MASFLAVYQTALEMLNDRGYRVCKDDLLYTTNRERDAVQQPDIVEYLLKTNGMLQAKDPDGALVIVYFYINKLGIKEIQALTSILPDNFKHIIFIINHKITICGQRAFNKQYPNVKKEFFTFRDMRFNVTKHALVPQHELLSTAEAEDLLRNVGLKIPLIKNTDAICRYYNGQVGQIFRIRRKNELYYRIVIGINKID